MQNTHIKNLRWKTSLHQTILHISQSILCMQNSIITKPKFSEEAMAMLNQYYVKIRINYGSPRIRETIYRIAQNISRLKLKDIVDAADVCETMQFYNVILQQLNLIVTLPSNPKDVTYEECLIVLRKLAFPISFEEVVRTACERNPQVMYIHWKIFQTGEQQETQTNIGHA